MTGRGRALLRLFAVQGTWNYERMLGVGMGYAAEPLLEDLKSVDPVRHGEAVVRSVDFFNAHPNLAGLALGAIATAEYDGVPGAQIARLRTALCSPLGSLGDQLFWAGLVPALVGLALVGVALGAGWWAVGGLLLAYNAVRLWTAAWSLDTGIRAGMRVGSAIGGSWIPRAIAWAGPAAGFAVGAALPVVTAWYLGTAPRPALVGAVAIAAAGVALARRFERVVTGTRFALGALALVLALRWAGL